MNDLVLLDIFIQNRKQIKKVVIDTFLEECHKTAVEKGFYDNVDPNDERVIGTQIALMHSELSEALEEVRDGNIGVYYTNKSNGERIHMKPEGLPVELADCIIRIFDLCAALNIDLYRALEEKMDYNNHREYKHGRENF